MARRGIWVLVLCCIVQATSAEGPRCPPSASPAQCREEGSAVDEHFFYVNGKKLTIAYVVGFLHLTCLEDVPLESEQLPRFERVIQVPRLKLTGCAPPPCGYAAALLALNVTMRSTLELVAVPAFPLLLASHLRGLPVTAFVLSASAAGPLSPDPSFLEPFTALRDLRLIDVTLPAAAALLLPPTLRSIMIIRMDLEVLPSEVFARLPVLTRLVIRDSRLRSLDLTAAPELGIVHVTAPLDGVALGPAVVNLTLGNVSSAELRGNCSLLRSVRVENVTTALPEGWLRHCGGVEAVGVARVGAGRVGAGELAGALSLRSLTVQRCELEALPPRWLVDAPNIRKLDLSFNNLEELPSELVSAASQLEEVDLSNNKLRAAVLGQLAGLPRLRELTLDGNHLGDVCAGNSDNYLANAPSALWTVRSLQSLRMSRVGLSRVCRDWRVQLQNLTTLDLRFNRIPRLEFADLQWKRAEGGERTEVDLRGNRLTSVLYSRGDYIAALQHGLVAQTTTLVLDSSLQCDCRDYWYARALRERPLHAALVRSALCADHRLLRDVQLHELLCDVPEDKCPRGCRCRMNGEQSELHCEGAELVAVPRVQAPLPPARALLLAHNNISVITLDDITPNLELLDLTDNQISSIEVAMAHALVNSSRSLRLAGNPLRCACDTLPALRTLAKLPNAAQLMCAQEAGLVLDTVPRLEASCVPALWLPLLAVASLLAASTVVAACLARPVARQRIKMFLFSRGLCLRWVLSEARGPPGEEAGRDCDAFISYSERDWSYATLLQQRLEPRRRVLVHHRDWTPGEFIPVQIQASVRRSRRTIVLLSENFLSSTWARVELREAYAAALRESIPRLLPIILPGLEVSHAAKQDDDLRAYLAAVTYLHWDDPDFWRKLELALPKPLPPLAPPTPAAPPATPAPALPA